MGLFGTLSQSSAALRVAELGLHVVGNNVANSNTPGYLRQELVQLPTEAVRVGGLLKGSGVRPGGIVQQIDQALFGRMQTASSDVQSSSRVTQGYSDLELVLNELGDRNLDNELTAFNASFHDLLNNPSNLSLRQLVVSHGERLADYMGELQGRVQDLAVEVNLEIPRVVDEVNKLTRKIAQLNFEIVELEGGRTLGSDASGLREQRYEALSDLAELIDIRIQEQDTGSVTVLVAGDYLVAEKDFREVAARQMDDSASDDQRLVIELVDTDSPLEVTSGKLAGIYHARDEVFNGFLETLDSFAADLARTVNTVHSQGQGARGFAQLRTAAAVDDSTAAIDAAGLDFAPSDGSFSIDLRDGEGKLIRQQRIDVRVAAGGAASTLESIAADIDQIDGIDASVDVDGFLTITAANADDQFTFGSDTSGFLAAAGLNTFFTGTTAAELRVNSVLTADASLLALSRGGPDNDTENLKELVDLIERPTDPLGGRSLREIQHATSAAVSHEVNLQRAIGQGLQSYHSALTSDHLSITGVNINEESIKMIGYQRAFQASARVVSTASDLLELLTML